MATERFGREFFARYYGHPLTRVADQADAERLAGLIAGVLGYLELPVKRVLDVGCGMGLLRGPLLERFKGARYVGLEVSGYLCRRYGWAQGSVTDFRAPPFDLVICHDVAQYLTDREASSAIVNLARLSGAALYFSALTERDWQESADQRLSDGAVKRRTAAWYEKRLRRRFRHLGFGLHLKRDLRPILWQLERAWR